MHKRCRSMKLFFNFDTEYHSASFEMEGTFKFLRRSRHLWRLASQNILYGLKVRKVVSRKFIKSWRVNSPPRAAFPSPWFLGFQYPAPGSEFFIGQINKAWAIAERNALCWPSNCMLLSIVYFLYRK